jgi:hypothetical protein
MDFEDPGLSYRKENMMKTTNLRRRIAAALPVIALSILTAPGVKAQCLAGARNGGTFAPELRSLQEPSAQDQEGSSEQPGSPQAQDQESNRSDATILGFWKKIEMTGDVVVDIGFEQFSAGGTELLNDSVPPGNGNNFCLGGWKRIGLRTYALVHPFFVFDDSGKKPIAVGIEKSHISVSRDGNTFRGRWTQDNYDFSGNLLPNTHFAGTLSGTRIAPGRPFPFPFPF